MRNQPNTAYCTQMVRSHNRDRFLQSLFLPQDLREAVLAVFALDAELRHVRAHVSEEMLGHVRYAWWEESLVMIAEGKKSREHPVLLSIVEKDIAPILLLPLVQKHRETYPEAMDKQAADTIAETLAGEHAAWKRAGSIIAAHRAKYGKKRNSWLALKLLCA